MKLQDEQTKKHIDYKGEDSEIPSFHKHLESAVVFLLKWSAAGVLSGSDRQCFHPSYTQQTGWNHPMAGAQMAGAQCQEQIRGNAERVTQ